MSVFFVTGGSRGLGRGLVLAALRQGHDVAFTAVHHWEQAEEVLALASAAGTGRCRAYELDIRDAAAVERVADQVLDDFETVDAVVCNAGINRNGLALSMALADWQEVIETNLTGSFLVARQFLPVLLANRFGRLIFLSSIACRGLSGQVNYAASKAGLIGLSGALAREYGRKGVTSNVVIPGFFETDMTRETMTDSFKQFWRDFCPTGRTGELDEVAEVILFLASPQASFVNGQTIAVTGGLDWAP